MTPLEAIDHVATVLRGLWAGDMVFVGGAVIGLLLTEPLHPRLRLAGHTQPAEVRICRWHIVVALVDGRDEPVNEVHEGNREVREVVKEAVALGGSNHDS